MLSISEIVRVLDLLHKRILKDKFASRVSEGEMLALVEAKDLITSQQAEIVRITTENTKLINEYTEIQNIALEHFVRKLKERSYTLEDHGDNKLEVIDVEDINDIWKDILWYRE